MFYVEIIQVLKRSYVYDKTTKSTFLSAET